MKITKEVKEFAIREFNAKYVEAYNKLNKSVIDRQDEISKQFKSLIEILNQQVADFISQYPDVDFHTSMNYKEKGERFNPFCGSVSVPCKKLEVDKVRFLAELSMGEDLSSITKLLEKYFA